uniref:LOW QUALITY PROTEIN: eukaryotic translation initiation factor 2D n=1 Tax=Petromyzon marinus TaxID=7757 RepID=A0AAJ7TXU2_PETMA|nr:LOW QUALITY PROTEIN: eukaryotic translation initiation factor 2D [Petromyzon marinus]
MFAKPLRIKSNTAIKGSDRRKLRADVGRALPSLSAEELSALVPQKEDMSVVRAYAHKGDIVTIYLLNSNPVFFEWEKRLIPTVYTLWNLPDMMPVFTTWPPVLERLLGGADLMLPGLVAPPDGLPDLRERQMCAINLTNSRAPIGVGVTAMSTAQMVAAAMKGRGIIVLHTYLDHLWAFGDKSHPPLIPHRCALDPDERQRGGPASAESESRADGSEVGASEPAAEAPEAGGDGDAVPLTGSPPGMGDVQRLSLEDEEPSPGAQAGDGDAAPEADDGAVAKISPAEMDELLLQCCLRAIKCRLKKSDLPLLTSTFFSVHLIPCCPNGKRIDMKKSSYKKLSKFLQSMQQRGLLQVKESSKGVENIVNIDWKHQELRSLPNSEDPPDGAVAEEEERVGGVRGDAVPAPDITALYGVSTRVLGLFQPAGHKKGDILGANDVRNVLTNYVRENDLADKQEGVVTVNPLLCDSLLDKQEQYTVSSIRWDDLMNRCLERMQPCHQLLFPGRPPVVRKGNVEPIDIHVAQRGGNKKVTTIKNVEAFGLDPQVLAHTLQIRVQASVTLSPLPGSKDKVIVQVQGNQVSHLARLLVDEFSIPRRFICGLEKAPKTGKKK